MILLAALFQPLARGPIDPWAPAYQPAAVGGSIPLVSRTIAGCSQSRWQDGRGVEKMQSDVDMWV